jgi:hypothetical protein
MNKNPKTLQERIEDAEAKARKENWDAFTLQAVLNSIIRNYRFEERIANRAAKKSVRKI